MDLETLFSKLPNKSNYIIDIGASHAPETDPIHRFLKKNELRGLCIEGREDQIEELKQNISPTFDICNGIVTPLNILDVFAHFRVPMSPDILKIDIDSYDLELLRTILTKYRPKVIVAEINEKIPYPIVFEVKFKENYRWDVSHFYGFSIAAGEREMAKQKYKIVDLFDLCNIVCMPEELCEDIQKSVKDLYRDAYILHPRRSVEMPHNQNVDHWLTLEDIPLVKQDIQTYFEFVNDGSINDTKYLKDIDFLLE